VARSGQKSIAQGLPWVNFPIMSPEGAGRYGGNRLRTSELDRVHIPALSGRKRLFGLPRVNPGMRLISVKPCYAPKGLEDSGQGSAQVSTPELYKQFVGRKPVTHPRP
jgi:hypothetical protein